MTHRLTTNYAKNYCNRTVIVKVIVENVVTCYFWDIVYDANRIVTFMAVIEHHDLTMISPIFKKVGHDFVDITFLQLCL